LTRRYVRIDNIAMALVASTNADDRLLMAIERFGITRLAAKLGLARQTVSSWKARGIPRRRRQQVIEAIVAEAQALLRDIDQENVR
jgi:hypothetical protein